MTVEKETQHSTERRTLLRNAAHVGALVIANQSLAARAFAASPNHVTATSAVGTLGGIKKDGVYVFKGVPYGADTSKRRFRQRPTDVLTCAGFSHPLEHSPRRRGEWFSAPPGLGLSWSVCVRSWFPQPRTER